MEQRYLGEILTRRGVLAKAKLDEVLLAQKERGGSLLDLMVQTRVADEVAIGRALADECGLPFAETIDARTIASEVALRLPISWSKSH
ncbi:MAG: hypothetical protein NVS3B20_13230 [Polyangiales bacterium]